MLTQLVNLFIWQLKYIFFVFHKLSFKFSCSFYLTFFFLSGVRSCYDEGKRVAETLMFDYHRQHGIGNTSSCT
jgi:hypothetical protein